MRFTGEATGFITELYGRLCLKDEKTGFLLYFSSDSLELLQKIAQTKERVLLKFEPVDMRLARVKPLQVERCPEEYRPLSFDAAFFTDHLTNGDILAETSMLAGYFLGGDTVTDIELDPLYEAFFYSALYDKDTNQNVDVLVASFMVATDWYSDCLYRLTSVEYKFSTNEWDELQQRVAALPPSVQDTADKFKVKRRPISSRLRYEVLLRDGHRCVDCGASAIEDPLVRLEVDHRIPVSKGGTNDSDNLQTLCWSCNNGKSDRVDHKLNDFGAALNSFIRSA
jgi:hypothetical protein